MSATVDASVPAGSRVASTSPQPTVECERGCGWRLSVTTLAGVPGEARDPLFRCHEEWHARRS
jgi:hypothetical protein